MAARVGQRVSQDDVSLASSGWATVRPAASRRMTQTSSVFPHSAYLPPSALSLSMLRRLFSGRGSILCDGAVEEGRKRGMEQRGNDNHTERHGHQQDNGNKCERRIMVQQCYSCTILLCYSYKRVPSRQIAVLM